MLMGFQRTLAALLLGLPLASASAVVAEDAPLAPEVQRRVAVVVLARRIRGYAAMAKASSDCLVEKGRLQRSQADQALANTLEELGISRGVLVNPLVVAVSPRLQRLLDDSCALGPGQEAEALQLAENEL
ncbi:hypothetical protein [Synechococcus sp. PROS-U-1]|jgi:hypothetical protein|uniref:hypothetical protein n=1 Tax=Synechococcus sp. PROS-U-1 TaxID=1400866 RepID=UPI001860A2C0|nr:hypothetical protein [Synechococcus sp. PROS-U-1]QNJ04028.1 hypothetical protein SynPROSU1_02434 [Synechococcus sp. PROS-U-1]